MRRLTGARAVLRTFITVAFPRMLERDDFLRQLVHGSGRLLGQSDVARLYQEVSKNTLAFVPVVEREMHDRLKALADRVREIQNLIMSGQFTEGMPSLSSTVSRLSVLAAR